MATRLFGHFWGLVIFALFGGLIFKLAYRMELIVPTDAEARTYFRQHNENGLKEPPPDYCPFSAVLFSIESIVPFIEFRQTENWFPASLSGEEFWIAWLRRYLWLHMSIGWLIATLFVISFTPDGPARLNSLWS